MRVTNSIKLSKGSNEYEFKNSAGSIKFTLRRNEVKINRITGYDFISPNKLSVDIDISGVRLAECGSGDSSIENSMSAGLPGIPDNEYCLTGSSMSYGAFFNDSSGKADKYLFPILKRTTAGVNLTGVVYNDLALSACQSIFNETMDSSARQIGTLRVKSKFGDFDIDISGSATLASASFDKSDYIGGSVSIDYDFNSAYGSENSVFDAVMNDPDGVWTLTYEYFDSDSEIEELSLSVKVVSFDFSYGDDDIPKYSLRLTSFGEFEEESVE